MILHIYLFRDSVTAKLTTTYQPKLFGDVQTQAVHIASPFFMMGFHLIKYELVELEVLNDQNTQAQQRAKENDSREGQFSMSAVWDRGSDI